MEIEDLVIELYDSGKINKHFRDKMLTRLSILEDPEDRQGYINDSILMSSLGIDNTKDEAIFFLILSNLDEIALDIVDSENRRPLVNNFGRLAATVYENRNKYPIDTIVNYYVAVAKAMQMLGYTINPKALQAIEKEAYPQGHTGHFQLPVYNISRWMNATKDIYNRMVRTGENFNDAKGSILKDWDKMEKLDFQYWLSYYTGQTPQKYPKLAQLDPNMVIPNIDYFNLKSSLPTPIDEDLPEQEEQKSEEQELSKRDKIEIQRSRIISRLNAAEKLLESFDGQIFAGQDQEFMLKMLQDLKRKVQIANKITVKSSLFEDLIYKEANRLAYHNYPKHSKFLLKVAQDPFADPAMGGGDPAMGGAAPPMPGQETAGSKEETKKAFDKFREFLEKGFYDADDEPHDPEFKKADHADLIVSLGQEVPIAPAEETAPLPPPRPPAPEPAPPPPVEDGSGLEVELEGNEIIEEDVTGDVIEAALKSITIKDVINRLEMLVSIYKKRDIARQLSILDIMLDRLGLGAFFPALGEAMGKALESNQYISTRIEDVLTKLKGAAESSEADAWVGEKEQSALPSPEVMEIKKRLDNQNQKEEERRQLRKQREMERLQKDQETEPPVGEQLVEQPAPEVMPPPATPVE